MGRDIPFDPEAVCDNCEAVGAFDFMGDLFCSSCARGCKECESVFVVSLLCPKCNPKDTHIVALFNVVNFFLDDIERPTAHCLQCGRYAQEDVIEHQDDCLRDMAEKAVEKVKDAV